MNNFILLLISHNTNNNILYLHSQTDGVQIEGNNILNKIRGNSVEREFAVRQIMNDEILKQKVIHHIRSKNGSIHDAEIIFDDMVITFVKKVMRERSLELEEHIHGYLIGIVKFLWKNYRRKEQRHNHESIDTAINYQSTDNITEEILITEESKSIINGVLDQIHHKCKSLLLYWAKDYSMNEMANLLSYTSEGAVRKKKSDCLKSLRQYLNNNPETTQELKNYLIK